MIHAHVHAHVDSRQQVDVHRLTVYNNPGVCELLCILCGMGQFYNGGPVHKVQEYLKLVQPKVFRQIYITYDCKEFT